MNAIEDVPLFEKNFERFMDFLQEPEGRPVSISPKRYGLVFQVDIQTLADQAHVHRNTLTRAPESESVQRFLRESIRVTRAALDVAGDVEKAIFWFKNSPIPTFDYKTPQTLISEGRTEALIRYLQSLQAGFTG